LVAPAETLSIPGYSEETQEIFKNGVTGYTLNNSKIFFWNNYSAWRLDLNNLYSSNEEDNTCISLSLYVDKRNMQTQIKKIRVGSNDSKIAIIVR
jgi:hypothetical protein